MSWGKETKRDLCAAVRQACVEGEQVVLRERAQLDAALEALQRTPHAAKTFSEEMWRERVLWFGWRPTIMHS